jgi:hypothetical protein
MLLRREIFVLHSTIRNFDTTHEMKNINWMCDFSLKSLQIIMKNNDDYFNNHTILFQKHSNCISLTLF